MTRYVDRRTYRARHCPDCQLRFPVADQSPLGAACPRCGSATSFVDDAYRTVPILQRHETTQGELRPVHLQLEVLLDNVRSLTNVGSIFRTADGVGIRHLYLGGITPTPEHPKLAKTALGAEAMVPWSHHPDPAAVAHELAGSGRRLWAIEGAADATSLFDPTLGEALVDDVPLVLVFGHEVSGVDPRVLSACERTLFIPMLGTKTSLNVSVTVGIAAYTLRLGSAPSN